MNKYKYVKPTLPILFAIGAAVLVSVGGIVEIIDPGSAIDIHRHDTYYVVLYFHLYAALAIVLLLFGVLYFLLPKITRGRLHYGLGLFHCICSVVVPILSLFPLDAPVNVLNKPRSYADYTARAQLEESLHNYPIAAVLTLLLLSAQVVFVINFSYCVAGGLRKVFDGRK